MENIHKPYDYANEGAINSFIITFNGVVMYSSIDNEENMKSKIEMLNRAFQEGVAYGINLIVDEDEYEDGFTEEFIDQSVPGILNFKGQTVEEVSRGYLLCKEKRTIKEFVDNEMMHRGENERKFYEKVGERFADLHPSMFTDRSGGKSGDPSDYAN